MAPHGDVRLHGDHDQRVSVPLPRSLPELQAQALLHFGSGHAIKMYQNGKVALDGPGKMAILRNADVIVVSAEHDQGRDNAPPITTNMAHYVKHPIEARPAESKAPKYSVQPAARFEGMSAYAADYVRHNVAPSKPVKAPRGDTGGYGGNAEFYGQSTYSQHFTWHEHKPKERGGAHKSMAATVSGFPFEGVSSYQSDYVNHASARPRSSAKRASESAPAESAPFEGVTTYALDFKKHNVARPGMTAGKRQERNDHVEESLPFEGASEYRRQFLKHDQEKRAVLYLEPALPVGRKPNRPSSAPAGSRRPAPRPPSAGRLASSRAPAEGRPEAPVGAEVPLGHGARPKTPLGPGGRPKTPMGARYMARPKTPLGPGSRPKTPLGRPTGARPKTPLRAAAF